VNQKDVEQRLAQLQHGRPTYALQGTTQFKDLESRLKEAAAWCEQYVNLADIRNCLRPRRIAPRPLSTNRWDAVDDISRFRRYDLAKATANVRPVGRFLVYFPDADLTDGAAGVASEGFFDVYNAPPWGTWVGYFEDGGPDPGYTSYLLAWVPDTLVGAASAGIEVNPEQCIAWFTDVQVGLGSIIHDVDLR
jgi:hypothetical protein